MFLLFLSFVLRLLFICVEVSGKEYTVSSLTIYDVANIGSVVGVAEVGITNYNGPVETVTFNNSDINLKGRSEIVYAADKLTIKVMPSQSMLAENSYFATDGTIRLNSASTVKAKFTFYAIGIETSPTVTEVEYDERMDDDDKAKTAFSCEFQDKPGVSTSPGGKIRHKASKEEIVTSSAKNVSVTFAKLTQMEEGEKVNEKDEPKKEIYECTYRFSHGGETIDFSREFTVTYKPDGRNWGGIIAACVIAGLIILLVLAFIIYRCCCVKRKRQEKQIPPDLKTSRSPVQETKLTSPETHPKFNDAVNFLDNVQDRFEDQPDIYRSFLRILTEYRSKKISKVDLAKKVEVLFEGHPDLVTGFKDFLKSRRENVENKYTAADLQVLENPAANGSDKETAENVKYPESHPKFNAASQFVDQVQTRFVDQPEVYKTFLGILNDFKPKNMRKSDLKAEVNILFADHPDLIEGFNDFISSRGKKSIPENEHVVVDMQDGEVHANAAVAEGKV